jgi:hypothetical protein
MADDLYCAWAGRTAYHVVLYRLSWQWAAQLRASGNPSCCCRILLNVHKTPTSMKSSIVDRGQYCHVLTISAARQSIRFEAGSCFLADSICLCVIGVRCGPPGRTLWTAGVHFYDMYCNNGALLIFNILLALALYVSISVVNSVQQSWYFRKLMATGRVYS